MGAMESELQRVVESIEKNYHPEKIILFGSLAEERATKGSDIDLLVIKITDSYKDH
jgi:predicted nucleotidyltransferase